MKSSQNGIHPRTRFSERKIFRSSIHINIGGSRSRSIDEGSGSVEFQVDPNTKKLVNTALNHHEKEAAPEFVHKPKRQFVNENEAAKFKASFDGVPSTTLTWNFNGKPLTDGDKYKIYQDKELYMLEIPKVVEADQGTYTCKIENAGGSNTADAELEVFVRPKSQTEKSSMFLPPTVDVPLEDTEFAEKEKDASLVCKFHNAIDGKASWYKDGREVGSWQAKQKFDGRTARLVLKEASKRVCGVYECVVKNSGGEAKTSSRVSLLDSSVKPVAPKFTLSLNDQSIEAGEKLVLETEVTGKPRPSLKWYKDNEELGSSQDIRMEFKEGKGRLIMDNLDNAEGSKFTCIAKNVAGEDQTVASVNVSGALDPREPPIFTQELQDIEVNDGDRVEMSVEVKGTPPIDIVWVHNNREIPPTDPVCSMVTKGNTHTLIIPEVFPEDSGEYVCEAYNDYGDTDTFCRLTVHEEKENTQNRSQTAPEFTIRPQSLHAEPGTSSTLSCIVTGTPPPSVQWSLGRQILKHSSKYKISSVGEEHYLGIKSLTTEDTGQYTCSLCNPAGTTSATCQVVVGEATPAPSRLSSQRNLLKHRNQVEIHSQYNDTESDITDVSSLDSETFQPHAPVTSGVFSKPASLKRNSEPFISRTVNTETLIERKISAPLNRNPDENNANGGKFVEFVNRKPVKVDVEISRKSDSPVKETIKSPVLNSGRNSDFLSQGRSKFSETVPKIAKKSDDLVIEKKGGITQVDFRGVLKNKQSKTNSPSGVYPEQNGHSNKLVSDKALFRDSSNDSKRILSPKPHFVESRTDIKPYSSSVHVVKSKENGTKPVGKISAALKKFEENTENAKTDFRSVLKGNKTLNTNPELKARDTKSDGQNSQLDFRNVLKKKDNVSSASFVNSERKLKLDALKDDDNVKSASFLDRDKKFNLDIVKDNVKSASSVDTERKFRFDAVKDNTSGDSSFENKSIQKQRAELVLNVRKKSFDIPRTTKHGEKQSEDKAAPKFTQSYTEKRVDSNFEVQSVKPRAASVEKPLTEFRSVLVKSDKANTKDNTSEIIRPIPRRLSQSKSLTMDVKPEVKETLEDKSVEYGSEVMLKCHVTGTPQPDISWSVNDKEIKQSKFFRMSYSEDTAKLIIAEAFSEDEGDYTCTASNALGSATTRCQVNIKERACTPENVEDSVDKPFSPTATPPKIYNISPSEFCILRGGTIEFKASYTSVPPGTVTWCKNKQDLKTGRRLKIETSDCFSSLIITDIQPCDSGRFDVKVTNTLGDDIAHASLTVEDVPEPPVGKPWVSEVTLKAATLSWYGPAYDGGCPISNYRVEMCDAEDREWQLVTSKCVSTTCRIEKLQPQTPYFFRVFSENKHGLSEPCMTPDVTVTSDRRPSALLRLPSTESDDVFMHESHEVFSPRSEYGIVSPLSPEELSFEHREVSLLAGRTFENFYNCLQEVGKGKFGSVYKCEEKSTGKIWAAKMLKCRESEKKKMQLEVEIMNKLKHPKILMLWDVFEAPRKMILVMEYIGGGELFERVIDDDFELTERDCIQFMRQICDAVHYMHGCNILHLDLKPENILCIKNESNKIKIIDFGLARYYNKGESVRVLFGTPEFIAPEVVNYDEIGFTTDMWSIGVICYVLLTGLSPFMGDSDAETLANVTTGEFDFEEEEFDSVSHDGKNFIEKLLVKNKKHRLTSQLALEHAWLAEDAARLKNRRINTKNLKRFMARRKWQKTGNAIRALGRMRSSLQKILTTNKSTASGDSMSSASGLGSTSSASSYSSSGSQNAISDIINSPNSLKVTTLEEEEMNECMEGKMKTNGNADGRNQQNLDINLNLTQDKNSAFVKNVSRTNETGEETMNPVDSCNGCSRESSSNQETETESKNRVSFQKSETDSKNRTKVVPEFTKEMVDSKAFPGDVVRFDVGFKADKWTSATWYFEEDILQEDKRHSIQTSVEGTCSLIIKDVCEDDDGEYSCKIKNQSGEDICSAELIVYGAL